MCSSLTLYNNKNKIVGRSLLWKMDKPKYIFMDRVYSIDNHINKYFNSLAKSNNCVYRQNNANNNFIINCYMKDINGYLIKNSNDIRMSINLNIKGYQYRFYHYLVNLSCIDCIICEYLLFINFNISSFLSALVVDNSLFIMSSINSSLLYSDIKYDSFILL